MMAGVMVPRGVAEARAERAVLIVVRRRPRAESRRIRRQLFDRRLLVARERNLLIALVKKLVIERGISVLFTEHSMDVVFAHADRILVLARGMLIADGTAESIRSNPEVQQVYLGTGKIYAGAAR